MSTFSVEKLPGERIVVSKAHEGFEFKRDLSAMNAEITVLLDAFDRPGFYIADTRGALMDFDDIMAASASVVGGTSMFSHPNVEETLLLIDDEVMRLSAEGFSSGAFGDISLKVFTSMDEALDYARANL